MSESLEEAMLTSASSNGGPSSDITGDTAANSTSKAEGSDINALDLVTDIEEAEEIIEEAAAATVAEKDAKLEAVVNSACHDPFAHYECAFGFEVDHSEPIHIPTTKGALAVEIAQQILALLQVQGGLKSYSREINNGKHDFSADFLESETRATAIAVEQLDNVKEHLKAVLEEVNEVGHDDHDVAENLRIAYGHAVQWIVRYRQIAVHSHVFYKVNYVLCAGY